MKKTLLQMVLAALTLSIASGALAKTLVYCS